jgi:hypothetical protein
MRQTAKRRDSSNDDSSEPLIALPRLERILLWTIRAWVIGITRKIPVEDQISEAFSRLGAPDATGQLYGFMWMLANGASRTIDIDCTCSRTVSADERCLLDILTFSQHRQSFEAMLALRGMMRPSVAISASESAVAVANALTAAGQHLTQRAPGTTRYALTPDRTVETTRSWDADLTRDTLMYLH